MKPTELSRIRKELETAAQTYKPVRRQWTKDEIEFVRDFWGRVPDDLLCEKLGRTKDAMWALIARRGLKKAGAK